MKKNAGLMFLAKWLKSPLTVASVTPSSPQLAKAMADCLPPKEGVVVELGGGTGPITRVLLNNVESPSDLIVVERDKHFCEFLRKRFPGVTVVNGDACDLAALVADVAPRRAVRGVVSGLPLLSMSGNVQRKIVEQAVNVAGEDGRFIQFSYGLSSPMKKSIERELELQVECAAHVWRNVPPAKVWVYQCSNCGGPSNEREGKVQSPAEASRRRAEVVG